MEHYFCLGSATSFFLELLVTALHSSPVAYWKASTLEGSSSGVISFCFFILFLEFSWQEYWSGLSLPSPVVHFLSELFTRPPVLSGPAWHGLAFHWVRQIFSPGEQGCVPWRGYMTDMYPLVNPCVPLASYSVGEQSQIQELSGGNVQAQIMKFLVSVIVSGGHHNFYCNSPLGKIWASLSGLGNIVSGVRSCHSRKEALTINVETFSQMRCPRRLSLHLLVLWGKWARRWGIGGCSSGLR